MTILNALPWRQVLAAGTAGVLGVSGVASANASGSGVGDPIVDGLVGPLAIDVGRGGDTLVAEQFRGAISQVSPSGEVTDVVSDEQVVGVDHGVRGRIIYTAQGEDGAVLKRQTPSGKQRVLANLLEHEQSANPDQVNTYGLVDASASCIDAWETLRENTPPDAPPEAQLPPAQYTGADVMESNPYAISVRRGGTFVADAAANAILHASWKGGVSTVAVLPPQPFSPPPGFFTDALGLPECEGETYAFEPVPTDVEVRRGTLFVSILPGGPEDPSLGARGAVYAIDRGTGAMSMVGGGLLGATDIAVASKRAVFAAELFGNRVSRVTPGGPVPVADLVAPAALEWKRGQLVVAYDAFDSGKLATVTP